MQVESFVCRCAVLVEFQRIFLSFFLPTRIWFIVTRTPAEWFQQLRKMKKETVTKEQIICENCSINWRHLSRHNFVVSLWKCPALVLMAHMLWMGGWMKCMNTNSLFVDWCWWCWGNGMFTIHNEIVELCSRLSSRDYRPFDSIVCYSRFSYFVLTWIYRSTQESESEHFIIFFSAIFQICFRVVS